MLFILAFARRTGKTFLAGYQGIYPAAGQKTDASVQISQAKQRLSNLLATGNQGLTVGQNLYCPDQSSQKAAVRSGELAQISGATRGGADNL